MVQYEGKVGEESIRKEHIHVDVSPRMKQYQALRETIAMRQGHEQALQDHYQIVQDYQEALQDHHQIVLNLYQSRDTSEE